MERKEPAEQPKPVIAGVCDAGREEEFVLTE